MTFFTVWILKIMFTDKKVQIALVNFFIAYVPSSSLFSTVIELWLILTFHFQLFNQSCFHDNAETEKQQFLRRSFCFIKIKIYKKLILKVVISFILFGHKIYIWSNSQAVADLAGGGGMDGGGRPSSSLRDSTPSQPKGSPLCTIFQYP